jgi:hypothetical protein
MELRINCQCSGCLETADSAIKKICIEYHTITKRILRRLEADKVSKETKAAPRMWRQVGGHVGLQLVSPEILQINKNWSAAHHEQNMTNILKQELHLPQIQGTV